MSKVGGADFVSGVYVKLSNKLVALVESLCAGKPFLKLWLIELKHYYNMFRFASCINGPYLC